MHPKCILVLSFIFLFFLSWVNTASAIGNVPDPEFPITPIESDTEDSENYGLNIPNQQFPDLRGSSGDVAASTLSAELDEAGVEWIRTDATPSIHRAYFDNAYFCGPFTPVCDVNKLPNNKVLLSINHLSIDYAPYICSMYGIGWAPLSNKSQSFNLEDWRKVVECISTEFADEIDAYEIWNEPTISDFQGGFQNGTAANYYQMLEVANDEIRDNDPTAIIVGLGGLLPYYGGIDGNERIQNDINFSNALLASDAADLVDAISLHAYDWGYYGLETIEKIYENTKQYKESWNKPVWITEAGHRADDTYGSQSGFLQYGYSALHNAGVEKIFWFALYDHEEANAELSGQFGIYGRPVQEYMDDYIQTPKTGLLRIETTPPISATMSVELVSNPSVHYESQWGIDWDRIQSGTYKVTFQHPGGYFQDGKEIIIPGEFEFTIDPMRITNIQADFKTGQVREDKIWDDLGDNVAYSTGLIRIETNPTAEATINIRSLDNPNAEFEREWGVDWETLNSGDYEVSFSYPYSTINGKSVVLPPTRTITIEKGKTTTILADLTTGQALVDTHLSNQSPVFPSGRIRVQTNIAYPATITIQSQANSFIQFIRSWGVDWERLEEGNYNISITPPNPPTGSFTTTYNGTFSIDPQQITDITIAATNGAVITSYYPE